MKAVGQQSLRVWDEPTTTTQQHDAGLSNDGLSLEPETTNKKEGHYVTIDKDVKLIRDHFHLSHLHYADMSPILIPRGYTKSYLDGEIDHASQLADIRRAYLNIVKSVSSGDINDGTTDAGFGDENNKLPGQTQTSGNTIAAADNGGKKIKGGGMGMSITICEGTGHAGVGSVVGCGNARVAAELGADVILVANGGLGRAFDELDLNRSLCLVSIYILLLLLLLSFSCVDNDVRSGDCIFLIYVSRCHCLFCILDCPSVGAVHLLET